MDAQQTEQALTIILTVVVFGMIAVGLASMATGAISDWRERRSNILSSSDVQYNNVASSVRVAEPRTDGRTGAEARTDSNAAAHVVITAERRAGLISLCCVLRSTEMSREEARTLLQHVGLSFSNDIWTAAKPAPAPVEAAAELPRTPWADRPFDPRAYHEDAPELQYQNPV